ncbi:hypothetical protein NOK12_00350 [Nocardioides sp. OK12]|uniref:DUF4307 domain-containing protein n=1 Tax=Nocardioides marinisabuli TaxID=419476 RepID=A0A7Y9JQA2_9ACTN|nr:MULTISPECIES: DUF4307 domain-containing protein [Nocardioides]NYD57847.1 hypothetical protein [Nocardioides marinisabuli]GHJ57516.1 hypothetical protein NOK12_00350 [Nocardioides sp. OK12]
MTSQDLLTERYGAPAPWRRRSLLAAVAVVAAVSLAWLAWTTLVHANPSVRSDIVGFDVVDDHTTTAVVDVRVGADATDVQCLVRAYAADKVVVGERVFTPTGDGRTEVSVRTERLATAIENVGCTADGQSRPR